MNGGTTTTEVTTGSSVPLGTTGVASVWSSGSTYVLGDTWTFTVIVSCAPEWRAGEWYDQDATAAWSWISGALQPPVLALEPIPANSIIERDKIIEQVTVVLRATTGAGYALPPTTVTVTVYSNGVAAAMSTHTITPDMRPEITWRPPLICAVGLVQVGVAGVGPVEIESISCRLELRERVHG